MPYFLAEHTPFFPHPLYDADDDGLLAIGSNLKPSTLISAYSNGIFPWYNEGNPILWWFTDPRCVLFPSRIRVSKTMAKLIKQNRFELRINTAFEEVISNCKFTKRQGQSDTWINDDILEAFIVLNKQGVAQSIEVFEDDQLVGGLYGVVLGKIFFGESMFSLVPNASKFALIKLAEKLEQEDFLLIDCQQTSSHLLSMGAEELRADEFWAYLLKNKSSILRNEHKELSTEYEKNSNDKI